MTLSQNVFLTLRKGFPLPFNKYFSYKAPSYLFNLKKEKLNINNKVPTTFLLQLLTFLNKLQKDIVLKIWKAIKIN